jgi:hypothetical protein
MRILRLGENQFSPQDHRVEDAIQMQWCWMKLGPLATVSPVLFLWLTLNFLVVCEQAIIFPAFYTCQL